MQKKGCEGKSLHCKVWWLSNNKMTVKVTVNSAGIIIEAAPIVSKFIGQELRNLSKWMNKIPGFRMERIDND